MRFIQTFALIAFAAIFIQASPTYDKEPEGIEFFDGTWEEALQAAKDQNKIIFMDAYTTWCGPCKIMSRNTFTDAEVGEYFNDHYINMKVDMEKGMGPTLAQQYRVSAYPTLLFINGDGEVVHQTLGYHDPQRFLQVGKDVLSKQH